MWRLQEVSHKVRLRKQRAGDGIVGGTGLWLQEEKGSLVQYLQLYAEQDPEMKGCAQVLAGCF